MLTPQHIYRIIKFIAKMHLKFFLHFCHSDFSEPNAWATTEVMNERKEKRVWLNATQHNKTFNIFSNRFFVLLYARELKKKYRKKNMPRRRDFKCTACCWTTFNTNLLLFSYIFFVFSLFVSCRKSMEEIGAAQSSVNAR